MIEPIQTVPSVREIKSVQTKSHGIKLWGSTYRRYLKRYALLRWIMLWIWCNGHPLYLKLSAHLYNREAKRWRRLVKLSDFVRISKPPVYKLTDSIVVETPAPVVFPSRDQGCLVSPHDAYIFPEIYVATLKNAMIYGGTNLILVDDEVICHDLYDLECDYFSEELHGCALIDPKSSRIRWLLHDESPEPIPAAASFVDSCAHNYAHWITEVLSRIAMFCAEERFHCIPIVVNGGLHKNIMESLFRVAGSEREIITLPIGRVLAVDELYLTSVTGYVPFGQREKKLSGYSHGMFSPDALGLVRNYMDTFCEKTERQEWPEKIFLRRNSGVRKLTNTAEIERLMVSRGYAIVEAENLTFSKQVQLFKNAKIIVAPTGAALANAIFCKPATQTAILMAKHENMIYRYWCNMLSPIGINVSYVLGNIVENMGLGIHGDFSVDIADVIYLLDAMERK